MRNKYYLIALLILVIDQITKWIARASLANSSAFEIIPGYLRFAYASNTGVAFGLFHDVDSAWKPYLLGALAIVAIVVIYIYGKRTSPDRNLLHWALAITMGGILGNFVDRIFNGYVVDFIEFHVHEAFYWPTFNVADSAITIGIALLLIDSVKNPAPSEVAGQSAVDNQS
jgi:signal peptidase II